MASKLTKPALGLKSSVVITVKAQPRFVSRGGDKLAGALDAFPIDVHERICADVGASTGGFTDCLLQNGAAKVYALDVGYGQIAYTLRQDARVVVMERTNVRYVEVAAGTSQSGGDGRLVHLVETAAASD